MITCPTCGRTSYNPNDERNRYCGACHQFHDDMAPATRTADVVTVRMWRDENGYADAVRLASGQYAFVFQDITGGEIGIGSLTGVSQRFNYPSMSLALDEWERWSHRGFAGDPAGWVRHLPSYRRRRWLTDTLLWEYVAE